MQRDNFSKSISYKEEYETLKTIVREGTVKLDEIHNYIEANLNARIMKD